MSKPRSLASLRAALGRSLELSDAPSEAALLAALFDRAGDAILILDEHARVLAGNRMALELLGASGRELEGLALVELHPAREAEAATEAFQRALQEGKVRTQIQLRRRDGVAFPADLSMSSVQVEGRTIVPVIARDAAEQRETEQQLGHARDEALAAARTKSRFLASMSHEIRTPLNVIMGYNALIRGQLVKLGNTGHDSLLHQAQEASARLMATLNGILDISKMESGAFERRPVAIHLPTAIADLVSDFRVLTASTRTPLECRIDEPDATIRFDEYCLTRSLTNLLQNAFQLTESGTVTVHLYRDSRSDLRLDVADEGPGIDEEALERIFEPFAQERSGHRGHGGSGLGLALVRHYLELNGASVSVDSRQGEGSRFSIRFDPASEQAPPARRTGDPTPGPSRLEDGPRPTVLLVEDDIPTQAYMEALLRSRYHVMCSATGDEARRHLESHGTEIRVVLMDLSLKGSEDGLTLTRAIRAHPEWRRLPVIATTAHAFPEDRREALEAGCNAFLAKPLDHAELLLVMDRLVRDVMS